MRDGVVWCGISMTLLFSLTAAGGAGAAETPATYEPARSCASCHEAIHKAWSDSPHARAATSPAFVKALGDAVEEAPDKERVRRTCVWCHAPTTLVTGDTALTGDLAREGITCDFCHTVAEVRLEKPGHPFVLAPGEVKRGPFEYVRITGHETAYSPLHKASPLLCASCHEFVNALGVAVLSTYSDWKAGPYPARGVPCQDCHMALVPGAVVKDSPARGALRLVNLHRVVGGSARSQLDRGLDLKVEEIKRSGETAALIVTVTNVAAGHPVPGGLANRSLVLAVAVEAADGSLQRRQERVYRREIRDAQGRALASVADLFLKGASVGRDNRIKPLETRRERFSVSLPQGARAVIARLEYRESAGGPATAPTTTLITEVRKDL